MAGHEKFQPIVSSTMAPESSVSACRLKSLRDRFLFKNYSGPEAKKLSEKYLDGHTVTIGNVYTVNDLMSARGAL